MSGCRNSLNCVVPPYMLREIIENGTPQQRQQALRAIVSSEAIRVQREVIAKEGPPEGIMEAAPGLERIIYSADNGGTLPGRQVRSEGDPPTGDPAALYASSDRIQQALGWRPRFPDLETIVRHAWHWHTTHPRGYEDHTPRQA